MKNNSTWSQSDIGQITALLYAILASISGGWFSCFCYFMASLYMLGSVLSHFKSKSPPG